MTEPNPTYYGLAALLLDAGVVTADQVEAGLARTRETGSRIGEALVEIGAATEVDIGWALARQLGLPLVDLQSETLDPVLLRQFPAGLLYRLHAVPLLRSDDGLSIAFSDPTETASIAHLEGIAGCRVRPSVTTPSAIRQVLAPLLGAHVPEPRQPRPDGRSAPVVWDRSGVDFLHFQVMAAQRANAVAIHFVAEPGGVHVYHRRVNGLVSVAHEPPETYEALLTQLELLGAPLEHLQRDVHREALVDYALPERTIPLGIALLAHGGATHVTLKLPARDDAPERVEALGLDAVELARVREILDRSAGLVLVSGPVGSGCSTTLACLLAEALREDRSAMVFGAAPPRLPSDRVVFVLPGPAARGAWEAIVLAHQPDVVVLDDITTGEDVSAFTSTAGTGRLVLARADWGDTFALLEHLGSRPHARSATANRLQVVLQQRLFPPAADTPGVRAHARFEVLVVSDALRESIRAGAPAPALRQLAHAEGFRGFDQTLARDVQSGLLDPVAFRRALTS